MLYPTVPTTWHNTLEEWTESQYGRWEKSLNVRPVAFAPFEAHRPEPFYALPVVLFVLTGRTLAFHREFVQAVDLIRISTASFRPVLFTDTAQTHAIQSCDWPVEQCIPERLVSQNSNWLVSAADHLRWAQRYFGATYVFAPQNTEQAATLLRELATAYNAESAVSSAAAAILAQAPNVCGDLGQTSRGGWEKLPVGEHQQTFASHDGHLVEADIRSVARTRGILIGGSETQPGTVHKLANSAGWSSITIDRTPLQDRSFAETVLKAGAQALARGGPTVLVGGSIPQIEVDYVLTPSEGNKKSTLRTHGQVLHFPASATPRVLNKIARWLTG